MLCKCTVSKKFIYEKVQAAGPEDELHPTSRLTLARGTPSTRLHTFTKNACRLFMYNFMSSHKQVTRESVGTECKKWFKLDKSVISCWIEKHWYMPFCLQEKVPVQLTRDRACNSSPLHKQRGQSEQSHWGLITAVRNTAERLLMI